MSGIIFFEEDARYRLQDKKMLIRKIKKLIDLEGFTLVSISIVVCSDNYLLDMNKKYLKHNYFTDILTFDQSEIKKDIEGDLYISIDRIKENAALNKTTQWSEFQRVVLHGVLHLVGYNDQNNKEKAIMREKENFYLAFS